MSDVVIVAAITASAGIFGASIGVLGSWIIANRTARIEQQKHFRELGMQVALIKFQKEQEMAQTLANITHGPRFIPPFSVFVVDGVKMMEIISDGNLTSSEVGRRLAALNKFTESVISEMRSEK